MPTTNGSKRIFHNAYHYRTSYYNEIRTSSVHKGTDYGTVAKNLPQYPPLDGAIVRQVVNTESNGDARGCRVRLEWPALNLGMILQHLVAGSIPVKVGQTVGKNTQIGLTGMTGKYSNGTIVSTGVHAHVEVYYIDQSPNAPNNLATFDFEKLNFDEIDKSNNKEEIDMTIEEVTALIDQRINKKIEGEGTVPAWAEKTGEWEASIGEGIVMSDSVPDSIPTKVEVAAMIVRSSKKG